MAPAERRRLVVMNLRVGSVLPPASALAGALRLPPGECCTLDYPDSNQVSVAVPVPGTGARVLSIGISTGVQEAPGNAFVMRSCRRCRTPLNASAG